MEFFVGMRNRRECSRPPILYLLLLLICSPVLTLPAGEPIDLPWADRELERLERGQVERQPWQFSQFPILAWRAPPGTATLDDFKAYKEAGFNLHPTNPDDGFHRALDFISETGLYAMPFRQCRDFGLPAAAIDFEQEKNRKSIVGWIACHQPSQLPEIIHAVGEVGRLMREDPTRWTIINLPPPHRFRQPSLEAVVKSSLQAGMPLLSYEHYVTRADGTTSIQEHFDNLEALRRLSLQYDVPFWASALPAGEKYRRPSESDLRWKQFTNLAYGAKGLAYFSYWGGDSAGGGGATGVIDGATGARSELYGLVQKINLEVARVGDILLSLSNLDVVHTNPPAGHRRFQEGNFWIERVEAKDALISFFTSDAGDRYAMVVNKLHGVNQTAKELTSDVKLTFDRDVSEVEAISWLDGTPGPLKLQGRSVILPIAGGTGVLLRAKP
jgi:hypothetical protein